ncbi:hypothetical protein [Psychromonas aquimarina]|uniref:hypothetical protein n=1 Tax=Psychromonas aquimarina TaxID=444919 RepID=UPI0004160AE8|nr:hypothetical protein [Psychromonas aquimarina]
MQFTPSDIELLKKARKDVENWRWMKWVQLVIFIGLPFLVYYSGELSLQNGIMWGVFVLYVIYFMELMRNWKGLKKELLLIKCLESN